VAGGMTKDCRSAGAGGCLADWLWVLAVEMTEGREAAALLWCSSGQGKGQALAGFRRRKGRRPQNGRGSHCVDDRERGAVVLVSLEMGKIG